MVVELVQYKRDGTPTGVVVKFDVGVVESIERETYSERRIKAVGKKFEPRDTWYRRRTDTLRISGKVPRSKAIELQNALLLPYPSTSPKEGYWWAIRGLASGLIDSTELWAWSGPLNLASERLFCQRTGEEYYSFRLEFRWVGRVGIRVIVEVYDVDTNKPPSFATQTKIYIDGVFVGTTNENGKFETKVSTGSHTFRADNPYYSPNEVTQYISFETTVRIGIAAIH